MKRRITTVFALLCSMTAVMAQDQDTAQAPVPAQAQEETGFNRWSVDLNAGLSKASRPYDPGYFAKELAFNNGDIGIRYMLNNKFGIKGDFGYHMFDADDSSLPFSSEYYRTSLQGVANLGRVMNFETWTKTLNVQAHAGAGYSWLTSDNLSGQDQMLNFIVGLNGQIRLFDRVALNADFSIINNAKQTNTFNGTVNTSGDRVFNGTIYNATVGLSIYLGKHKQHADWYTGSMDTENLNKINELQSRLENMEIMLNDTDRDGVPDYLDTEPNTTAGVSVDTKGRAIDHNMNGVPDELETYIEKNYSKKDAMSTDAKDKTALELINGGYVAVFFNTKSTKPTKESHENLNFILRYMQNHPEATCELYGYADEIGKSDYNDKLSENRAKSAKDILVKAGIGADRLIIKAQGEDNTVDRNSEEARNLVRRVTFTIK